MRIAELLGNGINLINNSCDGDDHNSDADDRNVDNRRYYHLLYHHSFQKYRRGILNSLTIFLVNFDQRLRHVSVDILIFRTPSLPTRVRDASFYVKRFSDDNNNDHHHQHHQQHSHKHLKNLRQLHVMKETRAGSIWQSQHGSLSNCF